jgi:hypothetical protein
MSTPILPKKGVLKSTTLSPTALIRDQQVDDILADHYALLAGIQRNWRLGQEVFIYTVDTSTEANALKTVLEEYDYTAVVTTGASVLLTVSWAD